MDDLVESEIDNWYGPETATFGDRLAAARDSTGMSQAQLAKRLGIKPGTLRAWENNLSEPRANRLSMNCATWAANSHPTTFTTAGSIFCIGTLSWRLDGEVEVSMSAVMRQSLSSIALFLGFCRLWWRGSLGHL